jgi:hypothetical protein
MSQIPLFARPLNRSLPLLAPSAAALLLLASGCKPEGSYEGRIVDGLTGKPRAELVVLARSKTTDMGCQVVEGRTDADGRFKLDRTCDVEYTLTVKDDSLMLAGGPTFKGGSPQAGAELEAWRSPKGGGVYVLTDDGLKPVKSRTKVMRDEKIVGTETVAMYPETRFDNPTAVPPGSHLVISGKGYIEKLKFVPIVPETEKRTFASGASMTGHPFFGVDFTSDTEYTAVTATLDESKIKSASDGGEGVTRYIPAEALPAGQYGLFGDADEQAFILAMGAGEGAATAAATPPADGAAPAAQP